MDSSPSLKQLVQQGWKYHRATFDLYLWLGGTEWSQAAIEQVMLPELSRLAAADRGAFESELRVRKVSVDLAGTRLTDNALAAFLASWPHLGLSHCSICFKLQRNLLTDKAMSALGHFAVAETTGVLEELHATHQLGPGLHREAVLHFLSKLSSSGKYPLWVKRRRCFRRPFALGPLRDPKSRGHCRGAREQDRSSRLLCRASRLRKDVLHQCEKWEWRNLPSGALV